MFTGLGDIPSREQRADMDVKGLEDILLKLRTPNWEVKDQQNQMRPRARMPHVDHSGAIDSIDE